MNGFRRFIPKTTVAAETLLHRLDSLSYFHGSVGNSFLDFHGSWPWNLKSFVKSCREISTGYRGGIRGTSTVSSTGCETTTLVGSDSECQPVFLSNGRKSPVIGVTRTGFLHLCQVREIGSTHQQSLPRKKLSCSSDDDDDDSVPSIGDDHWRPTFKDPTSKIAMEVLKTADKYTPAPRQEPRKRLPRSEWKPMSEYRQSIIDNSTKNNSVVPKKWKRLLLNREVVNVVMFLKRAKGNPDEAKKAVKKRVCRLLKLELMLVLSELQRTDEWMLANQVFNVIRKESWYKPDIYLYQTMVQLFGRGKQINEVQRMFVELEAEGLKPNDSIRRELLRAYVFNKMITKAIDLYKDIQKIALEQNSELDRAARTILFHGLNAEQKEELYISEKKLGYDWS